MWPVDIKSPDKDSISLSSACPVVIRLPDTSSTMWPVDIKSPDKDSISFSSTCPVVIRLPDTSSTMWPVDIKSPDKLFSSPETIPISLCRKLPVSINSPDKTFILFKRSCFKDPPTSTHSPFIFKNSEIAIPSPSRGHPVTWARLPSLKVNGFSSSQSKTILSPTYFR